MPKPCALELSKAVVSQQLAVCLPVYKASLCEAMPTALTYRVQEMIQIQAGTMQVVKQLSPLLGANVRFLSQSCWT